MRVGFLFLNGRAGGWQLKTIRELATRAGIEVLLLDAHCNAVPERRATALRRLAARLTWLARAIEYWVFLRAVQSRPKLQEFMEQQNIGAAGVGRQIDLSGASIDEDGRLCLDSAALQMVAGLSLDVLVSFVEMPCSLSLGQLPRFGMWQFHYADGGAIRRDLPVGFWEVYFKVRRTMVTLEKSVDEQLGRWVLKRGWYQTEQASWTMNQVCALEYGCLMLGDALSHLQLTGELLQAELDNLDSAEQPQSHRVNVLQYWACLVKLAFRRLQGVWWHRLFWEQWYLLIGPCRQPLQVEPRALQPVASSARTWWADPFLFTHNGKTWVFAEEKPTQWANADICVFEWTGSTLERRGTALSPGYHVSYPFVFHHGSGVYMIPETSSGGTVELWECVAFPLQWRRRRVLLQGLRAADSTLLQYGGRWWMFANVSRSELIPNLCIELFVYSTDDPVDGEWVAHDANPVVTDCRRSRMAGPFIHGGGDSPVFRMCQSNSRVYGESIVVCRIDKLSQTEYQESLVRVFEPDWDRRVIAMHHLCSDGELVVMDAKRRLPRAWH